MILFTDPFNQYIRWWQHALSQYFEVFLHQPSVLKGFGLLMERYLETKKIGDRMMEELWRNSRLPPAEEITRIHERLNLLEARWASLHEEASREGAAVQHQTLPAPTRQPNP